MFTIKVQTVKEAAEKYFDNHLSVGEYVSEGEAENEVSEPIENLTKYYTDQPIKWHGSTAEKLGLKIGETVTKEQFSHLLDNINPTTLERLTARTNDKRRLYFDATSSAPKSVSVMAITMGDTRLIKAHEEATQMALKDMENYVQTRVRTGGQNTIRKTNNMLVASATHTTSRANDPQLHSHNLIFNVTWDEIENKFKALEAFEIYNNLEFFTENYRNHLAKKVIELGYDIERAKHGWELKGVSKEICDIFSKRSNSIKEAEQNLEKQLGRPITNYERSLLFERNRKKKDKNLTLEKAIENQKSELTKEQLKGLEFALKYSKVVEKDKNKIWEDLGKKRSDYESRPREPNNAEKEAVSFAVAHIFERQSVVKKNEIIALALKTSYGEIEQKYIEKVLEKTEGLIFNPEKGTVGTIAGLAQEFFITSFIEQQKNKASEIQLQAHQNLSETLRKDQSDALNKILSNRDQIMILEGGAGSGKSHILKHLTSTLKEKNISVTATAPTTGATQNLVKDIGVEASTIQKILHKPSQYEKVLKNGYLIVDEAGLLSLNQMEAMFMVADKFNTRILLVGDTKQHHGVEAGDALRAIKTYTNIEVARLTEIERQKMPEYREAVKQIQNMNVKKAWDLFDKMGVIHSKDDYLKSLGKKINIDNLEKKMDYDKLFKTYKEKITENKSVIIVTPTKSEVDFLTNGLRELLTQSELKLNKIEKEVFASTRFTAAEKMSTNHYIARDNTHFVHFMEKTKDFDKNSIWKVKEIKENSLLLEDLKTSKEKEFNPKEFLDKSFDVIERKTIEIKEGETLLIQKNERVEWDKLKEYKSKNEDKNYFNFTNGELVKVKEIKNSNLILEDGRVLTENSKNLDYGYVSTSYSSQGKTCDHVIVAMTNSGGRALNQEQFYVSTSRGRHGIDIFVEDREFIQSRIEAIGNREFNLNLMEKDQKELIKSIQGESLEKLQEQSKLAALKYADMISKDSHSKEKLIENDKVPKLHWKDKLREFKNKLIEPLKEKISDRIQISKQKIAKEQFPLEREFTPIREKIMNKGKDLELEKDF